MTMRHPAIERLTGSPLLAAAFFMVASLALTVSSTVLAADKSKLLTEVHFDPGSSAVSPGGRQKIERAIAAIQQQNPREIRIIGFTDSTGDDALNLQISRNRADSVANVLIDHGIKIPMIIEGKGEKGAPFKIPDDVSEPLNRCVGIIAVGGNQADQPTL